MALNDSPGTAVFLPNARWGHFVFLRNSGLKFDKPCLSVANIQKTSRPGPGWEAAYTTLRDNQKARGSYNPQLSFPLEEVPALIAALAKVYHEATGKEAPIEGQVFMREFEGKPEEAEAHAFVRGSSEF